MSRTNLNRLELAVKESESELLLQQDDMKKLMKLSDILFEVIRDMPVVHSKKGALIKYYVMSELINCKNACEVILD
jgi:hypothetical protein